MTVEEVAATLPGASRSGKGWSARCPAHADTQASLSIGQGEGGRVLLHCHAGCEVKDVLAKIGLTLKDLTPSANGDGKPRIVATYDYRDESGSLLFQVVRFEPKDFRQRRPKEGGGWDWKLGNVRRVVYRLPELLAADPAETIFIVEGEKDADRLANLGTVATTNPGGAGKWKPEFADYLSDRQVVILPDCDEVGRKHADSVARSLVGKAASVRVLELPGLAPHGDVSDWLSAGGTIEELQTLVDTTPQWKPAEHPATPVATAAEPGLIKTLADLITADNHFAQDAGDRLYHFSDGCYRQRAEEYIKGRVKQLCNDRRVTKKWSIRLGAEVAEYIRVDAPRLWDRPPLDLLNIDNGLLRVADRVLLPHSPEHLSPVQLPVAFNPAASCANIDGFVQAVFPADAHSLAWEVPAWLMLPDVAIQKAVLLIGEGANGKSTWLNLLSAFIGRHNTAAVSLHKLELDKFAAARLLGKLANVCPDLPSEHLAGTSTFKSITGGDPLLAEHKFRDSFEFTPFCRLVFSANHPPRSADSSPAFFRRWVVVPFDRTFAPDEQIPRDVLDEMLTSPGELSGLLNRALTGLTRLRANRRFSDPESVQVAWRDFHATTDPFTVWAEQNLVLDPDAYMPVALLRSTYNSYAEHSGTPRKGAKAFTTAVRRFAPHVDTTQKTYAGRYQWCYAGLGLAKTGKGTG